jgi:hypothetical protein
MEGQRRVIKEGGTERDEGTEGWIGTEGQKNIPQIYIPKGDV